MTDKSNIQQPHICAIGAPDTAPWDAASSNSQDLGLIGEADGHPVRLRCGPLQLIHFRPSTVCQYGICAHSTQVSISIIKPDVVSKYLSLLHLQATPHAFKSFRKDPDNQAEAGAQGLSTRRYSPQEAADSCSGRLTNVTLQDSRQKQGLCQAGDIPLSSYRQPLLRQHCSNKTSMP